MTVTENTSVSGDEPEVRIIESIAAPERFARGWHCLGLAKDFRDGTPHSVEAFGGSLHIRTRHPDQAQRPGVRVERVDAVQFRGRSRPDLIGSSAAAFYPGPFDATALSGAHPANKIR
ncbi:hypothetical protein GCM10023353_38370 [Tomitella cavernea]|uniref:3-ketosteroid-9-alpha-hydroxylase n=1 Tax=Tomitella cavernea TaxID=1387982 RepID=A0ABP9D2M7_9ACTN